MGRKHVWLFAVVELTSISWSWAHHALRDTIQIDNKTIWIEADVKYDSLARSTSSPKAWQGVREWHAHGLMGIGGRQPDDRWHQWTGQHDRAVQFMTVLWKRGNRTGLNDPDWGEWSILGGAMALSLQEVDAGAFPDSLIGFLSHRQAPSLSMVTYERFDIGTETDTLPLTTVRSRRLLPAAALEYNRRHNRWSIGGQLGVQFEGTRTERIVFHPPNLEGQAYALGQVLPRRIVPFVQWRLGYEWSRFPIRFSALGRLNSGSEQDHWVGFGIEYIFKPRT